jgi:hypothetical protein
MRGPTDRAISSRASSDRATTIVATISDRAKTVLVTSFDLATNVVATTFGRATIGLLTGHGRPASTQTGHGRQVATATGRASRRSIRAGRTPRADRSMCDHRASPPSIVTLWLLAMKSSSPVGGRSRRRLPRAGKRSDC